MNNYKEDDQEDTNSIDSEDNKQHTLERSWSASKKRKTVLNSSLSSSTQLIPNKIDSIRIEIADFVASFVNKYLGSFDQIPMHEVNFYNNRPTLKSTFNPTIKNSIDLNLVQSQRILQCKCCTDEIMKNSHDTCIVYSIFKESGKLINLYDWFMSYCQICSSRQESTDVLQAKFTASLSELRLMGFIQSTKRKTDHVRRAIY